MNAAQMEYEFKVGYDAITNFTAPGYEPQEVSTFLTKSQERMMLHIINPSKNTLQAGIEQITIRRIDLNEFLRNANCTISADQTGSRLNGMFWDMPQDYFYMLNEEAWSNQPDCKLKGQVRIILDGATMNSNIAHFQIGESVTTPVGGNYIINSGGGRYFSLLYVSGIPLIVGAVITGTTSGAIGTISSITIPRMNLWVRPITHDEISINTDNPFKQPYDEMVWRLDYSSVTSSVTPKRMELITDGTYTVEEYVIRYYKRPPPILTPCPPTYPAFTIDGIASSLTGTDCVLDSITHRGIVDEAVRLAVAALEEQQTYQVKSAESKMSE